MLVGRDPVCCEGVVGLIEGNITPADRLVHREFKLILLCRIPF